MALLIAANNIMTSFFGAGAEVALNDMQPQTLLASCSNLEGIA
jgi:hypothetical protein